MKKKGFTLVEVLIVLIIITILASISIVAFNGYIDSANKKAAISECRNVLTSAQTVSSELYAEKNLTNATLKQQQPQILSLADSGGYIAELYIKAGSGSAKINHITYWNTARTYKVIYDTDAEELYRVYNLGQAERSYEQMVQLYGENYNGGDVLPVTQYLRSQMGNFFELTDEEKEMANGTALGWRAFASDNGVYYAAVNSSNSLNASLIYYNGNYYYHLYRYGGNGMGIQNAESLSDRNDGFDLTRLDNAMTKQQAEQWMLNNPGQRFNDWVLYS